MKIWLNKWSNALKNRKFILSLSTAILFLIISLIVNFIAGTYATERASLPVTDIILSNIPVFDVDGIFVYGPIILWSFMIFIFSHKPNKLPFTIKSIALFVIIRSIFISLTHIGPFPNQILVSAGNFSSKYTFGGDLFFSGHTGLPYLLALIFWENKKMRYFLIAASIFFGIIVLMGHLHYSIDVFAAFFITYSIFHIAEYFFKKDRILFFS